MNVVSGAISRRPRVLCIIALAAALTGFSTQRVEAQVLVRDISPASGTAFGHVETYNGLLVFEANGTLWRSDGTEAGTTQISTAQVDSPAFAMVNGVALFRSYDQQAGYELWRSDLTAAGTYQLADLLANGSSSPGEFVRAGDYVYFLTTNLNVPRQLWRSDGTAGGTTLIRTFSAADGAPSNLVSVGARIFFDTVATNGVASVWRSDGSAAGTVRLRDFADAYAMPATRPSYRDALGIGDTFFFAHYTAAAGIELWKSDGTPGGTVLVEDLVPGPVSVQPLAFANWNGTLAFIGTGPTGNSNTIALWRSQGTAATTDVVDTPAAPFAPLVLHPLGADLVFNGEIGNTLGLVRTDGTTVGTVMLTAPNVITAINNFQTFPVVDNTMYFSGGGFGSQDLELWRTDGTSGGTTRVADLWPGTQGSVPVNLTQAGGALYFAADDGIIGHELYRIGTPIILPTTVADGYATAFNTTLNVPAPGLLTNDLANGGGALAAELISGVSTGTLTLNPDGGFNYEPLAGFSGVATFDYRARTANGPGTVARVTITVAPGPSVPPTSVDDTYTTSMGAPLTVAIPGVLANDNSNSGGAMTAVAFSGVVPTGSGVLTTAATGAFTFTPASAFAGLVTFTYRASNAAGQGNVATVTINVGSLPPQPPTGLIAHSLVGNLVTLRWTAPATGPTPTSYIMDGGVTPGTVLASIPTGSRVPTFTFAAPNGAFYLRLRTVAGAQTSQASNEIRVFVNQAVAPSAPSHLLGLVNGSAVALSWRPTFGGGTASSYVLDVSGTLSASLPLGLTDSFAFNGVPGGSYTFRVRAVNAFGASAASNSVSLAFPGPCTGAPQTPADFLAYNVGNTVNLLWNPAAAGPAQTSFVLRVTGAFNLTLPLPTRGISSPVPPGSYTFTVSATNACGSSAQTAPQTVVVP